MYVKEGLAEDVMRRKRTRQGEILTLRWKDIHFNNNTFSIKQTLNHAGNKIMAGILYTNHDLVVCTNIGTPCLPRNLLRSFYSLIEKIDITKIRFHDLGHTHATLLLAKGVNVKVISERLGHSNIKITLDTYSHVLPTMQEDAVNKIEEIL